MSSVENRSFNPYQPFREQVPYPTKNNPIEKRDKIVDEVKQRVLMRAKTVMAMDAYLKGDPSAPDFSSVEHLQRKMVRLADKLCGMAEVLADLNPGEFTAPDDMHKWEPELMLIMMHHTFKSIDE